ncbi:hypothetical protein NDU88_003981 [Pleurodeles waltl]|uniref:Uncharacterized protein n=1 Tax=Pleurodeles waltl TaxID=8319 RepID=A0AAV7M6W5_PLEWA|nr:hypothetical protein NDU88_003981 [Pleurodeles waltl]
MNHARGPTLDCRHTSLEAEVRDVGPGRLAPAGCPHSRQLAPLGKEWHWAEAGILNSVLATSKEGVHASFDTPEQASCILVLSMGKDKPTHSYATNTITQYTTVHQPTQRITHQMSINKLGDSLDSDLEPSRAELLAAIQGFCTTLEIESVSIDVNLLRADLRKVAEESHKC